MNIGWHHDQAFPREKKYTSEKENIVPRGGPVLLQVTLFKYVFVELIFVSKQWCRWVESFEYIKSTHSRTLRK